ncbi:MAG: S41 family peptidase [Acidobacteriota bacterium]
MKKFLLVPVFLLLSVSLSAQSIPLKDVFTEGRQYFAILDTTGFKTPDNFSTFSNELKKLKEIKDVLIVSGKDLQSAALKEKLNGQNILLAGLLVEDNAVWKALNGGVFERLKKEAGSFPPGLGIKTIADNPFGDGISMVLTSKTAGGLNSILPFPKSDKSLYAVLSGQVLQSLNLNRKFLPDDPKDKSSERVSLDKALEDMNYYFSTVESVHPQLLKHLTADEYLKMKKSIRDTLALLDTKNDLTAADLSILLAEAAARFRDGHTHVPPSIKEVSPLRMPPFRLKYSNGKLFIGSTTKDLSQYLGCEIRKINQKKPSEFLAPSLRLVSAESDNYGLIRLTGEQDKFLAIKNVFNLGSFSATLKNSKGEVSDVNFTPVTFSDFQDIPKEKEATIDSYFEFLKDGAVAYFRYNQFVVSDKEKALIDSLFTMMDLKKSRDLIIDLRFNGGGNSQMGDYILHYITDKPYSMISRMEVKVSKEILNRGGFPEYKELEGMVIPYIGGLTQPENKPHKFHGRVILLIGPDTFSSACLLTQAVKDHNIGTIIGNETGGVRQAFGDILNFTTPNLNISFYVSYKVFYAPVPKAGDESHGTAPDIEMTDELLEKLPGSKDPTLDFTLNYIAETSITSKKGQQ